MDPDYLLSTEEVGEILKVSKVTIQRWCHEGKVPAGKIGRSCRINKNDLDRWFKRKLLENAGFS